MWNLHFLQRLEQFISQPTEGSTRKNLFKKYAQFLTRRNALAEPTSKEYRLRKVVK